MNIAAYALSLLPLLGYPLVGWAVWRYRGRLARAELKARELRAREVEDATAALCAELRLQLEQAHLALQPALADAQAARDKSSRYFVKISEMEGERDRIHQLYTDHTIGHGNAQNLMMRTIEDMARLLQEKGIRFQIPKVIHAVREEYQQRHEMPVRAAQAAAADAIHQAQTSPPPAETA